MQLFSTTFSCTPHIWSGTCLRLLLSYSFLQLSVTEGTLLFRTTFGFDLVSPSFLAAFLHLHLLSCISTSFCPLQRSEQDKRFDTDASPSVSQAGKYMKLEGTAWLFFQAQNRLQKAELYLMPTDLLVCQHIKKHECDPNVLCLPKPRESITALKSSNTFTPVYEQTKIQGTQTVKGFLK